MKFPWNYNYAENCKSTIIGVEAFLTSYVLVKAAKFLKTTNRSALFSFLYKGGTFVTNAGATVIVEYSFNLMNQAALKILHTSQIITAKKCGFINFQLCINIFLIILKTNKFFLNCLLLQCYNITYSFKAKLLEAI